METADGCFQGTVSGVQQDLPGHQPDDFRAADAPAFGLGFAADLFIDFVQGRERGVGEIHGYLRASVFFYVPADGLASRPPHPPGDGLRGGQPGMSVGPEVEVDGDEEGAGADVGGAGAGDVGGNRAGTEVGPEDRIGQLGGQGLLFAFAAQGEFGAFL